MTVKKIIESKRKKVEELEAGNQRAYDELRKATRGQFGMDTSDLRRELLIEMLIEWGILSEEQKLDFDIEFHKQVEKALGDAMTQIKQQAEPRLIIKQKAPNLLGPDGRRLI